MSTPLPTSRCRQCHRTLRNHLGDDGRTCPDGSGQTFTWRIRDEYRMSTSFDAREIDWLAEVVDAIERRQAWRLAQLTVRREIVTVARKVLTMRRGAATRRETV